MARVVFSNADGHPAGTCCLRSKHLKRATLIEASMRSLRQLAQLA